MAGMLLISFSEGTSGRSGSLELDPFEIVDVALLEQSMQSSSQDLPAYLSLRNQSSSVDLVSRLLLQRQVIELCFFSSRLTCMYMFMYLYMIGLEVAS